jgi:membrane protease YdiL (CAAX protease family)
LKSKEKTSLTVLAESIEPTSSEMKLFQKVGAFLLLTLVGIVVYTFSGYNYFMDSTTRLVTRIIVPIALAGILVILRSKGIKDWFSILSTFFTVSVGFLAAHFLGTWHRFIPGLSLDTAFGIAIAKFAEVLPIVVSVIALGFFVGDNFSTMKMREGNVSLSIRLGIYAIPLSYLAYILWGGTIIISPGLEFLTVIPWMILFAFSNAFMEELIFRGVFLDKLGSLLGERLALVQTSLIFALFHVSILQTTGTEIIVGYTAFIMILGLAWGYIVQKSDSIWGAVLAHIVADILVVSLILSLV